MMESLQLVAAWEGRRRAGEEECARLSCNFHDYYCLLGKCGGLALCRRTRGHPRLGGAAG